VKYFISTTALLVIILIFSEAGYFYIEYIHQDVIWDKELNGKHSILYSNNSNHFFIGLDKSRLNKFDRTLTSNIKVREVIEFNDSSNYYNLFSKKINMHLLVREKSDTLNKYNLVIKGNINGLSSAIGAKERLMLMLRQIEYDRMPK